MKSFEEFSQKNRERCESATGFNQRLESWSLSDWMAALVGEVGEAANVVKKLNRFRDGIPGNKETETELLGRLALELADAFVYLDLFFQRLGVSIEACVRKVFNEKSAQLGCPIKV